MLTSSNIKAMGVKLGLAGSVIVMSLTAVLPVIATAAPASQMQAVQNLNELLSNTKSMTADFNQTVKAGKRTMTSSGSMAVQHPSQLRWETKSPAHQLIVANDLTMWVYDKDLNQAIKQSVANQVGDTPALLLSGDTAKIADSFNISQPNNTKNYFKLTPKSNNAGFSEMYISFNGGKPVFMSIADAMGQQTQIRFSNISLNKKINADQFSFTPPKGVSVVNQ
ncbi:outer membrane lipoprotein chaperone LolA [Moraxella haemolytica]|uniref:outer membrane lipoprotein chaperone LolA n=1 Tax=Moraxella TaxID=475 RepID=UPI00254353B2|nr:outer membrane lipoprotein chaperone LolA [Moraxella sp. ZY171148]WII94667.1 outer membrane lipoprotein chaperone LolA [Moraxella sp. ZY171148]